MDKLDEELIKLIALALETDEESITPETGLGKHYNWDSLGHVAIMVELEKKYDIEINDENIEQLLNFSDIKEYISKHAK